MPARNGEEGGRRRVRLAVPNAASRRAAVDAELRFHIEECIEELLARGVSRERAEREVRERFGDVAEVRAACERIDAAGDRRRSWREWAGGVARDARLAVRALVRRPAFSLVALVTLALGVGATTAIFALLDGVVLRPLPYPTPDRLVSIRHAVPGVKADAVWGVSPAAYFFYRKESRALDAFASYSTGSTNFVGDAGAERVTRAVIDPLMFALLGAQPKMGRLLVHADMRPDSAPPIVVAGHQFWRNRLGADPKAIGRLVTVNSRRYEVVGVLEAGVDLPDVSTDLWFPITIDSTQRPINMHHLQVVARMRPGVTAPEAQRDLARLVARFTEEFPTAYSPTFMENTQFAVRVVSWRDELIGDAARRLRLLLAAVAILLVVACANVAGLFLVHDEARRRETALRTALGAARAHVVWHALTESLVLALSGGALGAALAWVAVRVTVATAPAGIPRLAEVRFGWLEGAVVVVVSVVAGLAFGLLPLMRRGIDLATLRDGGRGVVSPSRGREAFRRGLVVGQVALALVLLASAGLMVQTVRHLRQVRPGFAPAGVITFDVALPYVRYQEPSRVATFYRELTTRVTALPGVVAAGATTSLPLGGGAGCSLVFVEGQPVAPGASAPCVGTPTALPGYFRSMGIMVRGREPTWDATERKLGEVVVTRALAERFWPGQDAIGKGVRGGDDHPPYYRVVGVTDDIRQDGLDKPPLEAVYFPLLALDSAPLWGVQRGLTVTVRTAVRDAEQLVPALRRVVAELDPEVPIANVLTMDAVVAKSMARTAFTTLLLGVAAGMALLLSAVGLYGVVAYRVAQRRPEIGVRMALGARVDAVVRQVLGQSLRLAAVGVVVGLAGAIVATRALGAMLYDVSPADPAVLALVSGVLLLAAAAASWGPARRAARVDPVEVLRGD